MLGRLQFYYTDKAIVSHIAEFISYAYIYAHIKRFGGGVHILSKGLKLPSFESVLLIRLTTR